jgi:hypothetical protein
LAAIQDSAVLTPRNSVEQFSASPVTEATLRYDVEQFVFGLERVFGQSFAVVNYASGQTLRSPAGGPSIDFYSRLAELEQVAQRARPEIIADCAPVYLLGVPLATNPTDPPIVAVAAFLSEPVEDELEIAAAAREFAVDPRSLYQWSQVQIPWHPRAAEETCIAIAEKAQFAQTTAQLKHQRYRG